MHVTWSKLSKFRTTILSGFKSKTLAYPYIPVGDWGQKEQAGAKIAVILAYNIYENNPPTQIATWWGEGIEPQILPSPRGIYGISKGRKYA